VLRVLSLGRTTGTQNSQTTQTRAENNQDSDSLGRRAAGRLWRRGFHGSGSPPSSASRGEVRRPGWPTALTQKSQNAQTRAEHHYDGESLGRRGKSRGGRRVLHGLSWFLRASAASEPSANAVGLHGRGVRPARPRSACRDDCDAGPDAGAGARLGMTLSSGCRLGTTSLSAGTMRILDLPADAGTRAQDDERDGEAGMTRLRRDALLAE
jgi:hypothetical protein